MPDDATELGRVCGAGAFAAALAASGCHGAPSSPAEPPSASGVYSLPADRLTSWNPGIPGGIPARNTVCATVDASAYGNGALNATAAIGACPEGQVVSLSAGTFAI